MVNWEGGVANEDTDTPLSMCSPTPETERDRMGSGTMEALEQLNSTDDS